MKKLLSIVMAVVFCATFSVGACALDIDQIIGSASDYYNQAKDAVDGFIGENPVPDAEGVVNSLVDKVTGIVGGSDKGDVGDIIGDIVEVVPGISANDVQGIIDIVKNSVDTATLERVVNESVEALKGLGLDLGNGGNLDLSGVNTDLAPKFMDMIIDGLKAAGVDTTGFEDFLKNSELINFFASLYVGGGQVAPEPEIPQTGSSVTAIAALAILAIAATTTAVVCTKKED